MSIFLDLEIIDKDFGMNFFMHLEFLNTYIDILNILIVDSQLICLYLAPICPLPAWPPPESRTVGDISSASACAKDLQEGERSNAGRGCTMHIQCISMCFIIIALYTIHVTHSVVPFASFYPSCFQAHVLNSLVCFHK